MNPSYWLLMEDSRGKVTTRKFLDLQSLNDFLSILDADDIKAYEVLSGFSLRQEVFR